MRRYIFAKELPLRKERQLFYTILDFFPLCAVGDIGNFYSGSL